MKTFEKSQWIWLASGEMEDQYAEFVKNIKYNSDEKVVMNISCDGDYTLFVNGAYVASNQYGDFEHYKIYDSVDITSFLQEGENMIKVLVWHVGTATQRYCPAKAGLIYEILCGEEIVAFSDRNTFSRQSPTYASGRKKIVTTQLGFSFLYDATKENEDGYEESVFVDKICTFYPRPIKKSALLPHKEMKNVTRLDDGSYLIDLGGEVVGLPILDFVSKCEQKITVAWGEHIDDGRVRRLIANRDFSFTYIAKSGRNEYTNYMLRLGCRYLEITSEDEIELNFASVIPQVYKVGELLCNIEDATDRRIYDICVNTLKLSMMEHYVDCPWREQALYAFDSRNQMLCGYYAFENKNQEYARANLKLIGMDRREDGLLSICYPSGSPLAIPSFSLYYILAMREYIEHTGDISLAKDLYVKLCSVMDTFLAKMSDGLLYKFEGADKWNFYDWSKYSEGTLGKAEKAEADVVLNCLAVMALDNLQYIFSKTEDAFKYDGIAENLKIRIKEEFFDFDKGMFSMHKGREEYTVLGNSLAILAGVVQKDDARALCDKMLSGLMVDCSLSMKVLEYDALLMTDAEKYSDTVLNEIRNNYKKMLEYGSDTVWETLDGASAFGNAGSLCHGWSAVPVYIFHKLNITKS